MTTYNNKPATQIRCLIYCTNAEYCTKERMYIQWAKKVSSVVLRAVTSSIMDQFKEIHCQKAY